MMTDIKVAMEKYKSLPMTVVLRMKEKQGLLLYCYGTLRDDCFDDCMSHIFLLLPFWISFQENIGYTHISKKK